MYPGGPIRKPYAGVDFIPPVRDYEFGYWKHGGEIWRTLERIGKIFLYVTPL
jgi:hypothetical protein